MLIYMNEFPKLDTVIQAPYSYNFPKQKNVKIATRVSIPSDSWQVIKAVNAPKYGVGQLNWNESFANLSSGAPMFRNKITVEYPNIKHDALSDKLGLKEFPFNSCVEVANINLNGQIFTSYPQQIIKIHKYNADPHELALISPCSDTDEYTKNVSTMTNNPYREGSNATDSRTSRGLGCNYTATTSYNATTKILKIIYEWDEVLCADPYEYNNIKNPVPFRNLPTDKIQLNINFDPKNFIGIADDAEADPGVAGAVINATVTDYECYLLVKNWTPNLELDMPDTIIYNTPFYNLLDTKTETFTNPDDPWISQKKHLINSNTIRMSSIASLYVIFVTKDMSAATGPERFRPTPLGGITDLEIRYDDNPGVFRGLNQTQLYELSSSNGYNKRFSCFSGKLANPLEVMTSTTDVTKAKTANFGLGSMLFIRPSDMGLRDPLTMANADRSADMQLNVKFTIPDAKAIPASYKLEVWAIHDSQTYNFKDGKFEQKLALYTSDELLRSPVKYTEDDNKLMRVMGGSVVGDLVTGFNHMAAHPMTKTASKMLRNIAPLKDYAGDGTMLGNVASAYGYGNKKTSTKKKGGDMLVLKGGKSISAAKLRSMKNF